MFFGFYFISKMKACSLGLIKNTTMELNL